MPTAYGLDLAGFSGGNTGLARADRADDGIIIITVYENHVFNKKFKGNKPIAEQLEQEWQWVHDRCANAKLLVDTPIDMQGLPGKQDVHYMWELTMRPLDYAFGAMAPFANFIGAPAARFQHVMNAHDGALWDKLDTCIFETYPAASLEFVLEKTTSYKGEKHKNEKAEFQHGYWNTNIPIGKLVNELHWIADEGTSFTHDEIDAAMCALTGVVDASCLLQDDALAEAIADGIKKKMGSVDIASVCTKPPRGYVLLRALPTGSVHLKKIQQYEDDHDSYTH